MTTQLFIVDTAADTHRGTNDAKLDGSASGWRTRALAAARGSGVTSILSNTVTGATNGVEAGQTSGSPYEWLSPPVSADVTISGAITGNLWAQENNMSANVAINFIVYKVAAATGTLTQVVKSARTTELGFSGANTVQNFTATPGAGVALNRGDRVLVRVFGDDAGTMATGFSFTFGYNGTSAAADGDSYVTFTETFSFEAEPTGTVVYLTDTASDYSTAAVDREAWTDRGGGVANDVTNTSAGFAAPIQVTDTAGGTVVDWFTRPLMPFSLGGKAVANIRGKESTSADSIALAVEIAVIDAAGSRTVWGIGRNSSAVIAGNDGEITTTEAAYTIPVAGDDTTVGFGSRLNIRLYIDDSAVAAMVTGRTATTYYAGAAGATGDSYVTLPQTVGAIVFLVTPRSRPS